MILSELRDYIQLHQRVSLSDLVQHFKIEQSAIRQMLQKWVSKGKIRVVAAGGSQCGTSCCQCDPSITEIYEWVLNPTEEGFETECQHQ
jgi:putative ferrous iron transport protein C